MSLSAVGPVVLWILTALALGFTALMAWIGLTTFGPPDSETNILRVSYVAGFIVAAIGIERAIRTSSSPARDYYRLLIIAIALVELAFVIWSGG